MPQFKQSDRMMQFTSSAGKDVLLLESFSGIEGVSRLFEFHAELLAILDSEIDPKSIVGTTVTIAVDLTDAAGSRYFNGLVASFEQGLGDDEFNNYTARIVPSLWQLTLSTNCRVFQDKSVVEIIKAVISDYGLQMTDKTSGTYPTLDYCTQYDETDFNFISRLMEQAGIFYWFEHTDSDNQIFLGDSRDIYPDCPISSNIKYAQQSGGAEGGYGSSISELTSVATMVTGKHTLWDYDFRAYSTAPRKQGPLNSASPFGKNAYERYSWPSGEQGYAKKTDSDQSKNDLGKALLTAEGQASDAHAEIYHGNSNARTFCSGYTFTVTNHPISGWNCKYLLTEVAHHADQVPSYRATATASVGYSNQFKAINSTIVFKPSAVTPKPMICGPQTAKVVVPGGEEQAIDKLGRVCIQFFWDRLREPNTVDNTWVRVAQPWAGSGWGFFFWPRGGDEVVVQFIDGDPDCPIVVGSVYNSDNTPKYALPDMSTRSGIYTRSTMRGGQANANELRFEDKKGSEQIFLNAEQDMDLRVENDQRRYVGGKDSLSVVGDQLEKIGGKQHSQIAGDRMEKIGGKSDLNIGMNQSEKIGQNLSVNVGMNHAAKVGMNYALDAGMDAYVKAGMTIVIEAGMELTLKAAGGFINIGPMGVAISGPMVMINSGGAAGAGSPGNLTDPAPPTDPDVADDGTKGGKMN